MDKASLAAAARQAFVAGKHEQALASLNTLKSTLASADDLKWVEENMAEVEATAKAVPSTSVAEAPGVFPRIVGVKWRVDVAISTSHLERVMRPSIMMELALSDGTLKTFEVSAVHHHANKEILERR